jgi:mannosyltransferase OCH1-like enzyme
MIEKNIFQTFYTKNLRDEIFEIINITKNNNKDYTYYFFDDSEIEDFIRSEYDSEILKFYKKLNVGAAKADFWRYLVLYKKGGVYLDIDSCLNVSIGKIVNNNDNALITRESNIGSFVQWCMFYKKNHIILEKTINKVLQNIKNFSNEPLNKVTGPPVLSEVIEDHYKFLKLNNTLYDSKDLDINFKLTQISIPSDRFFGVDYNGLATFKHKFSKYLYYPFVEKVGWLADSSKVVL